MVTSELKSYVQEQLNKGVGRDEIKKLLITSGWSDADVRAVTEIKKKMKYWWIIPLLVVLPLAYGVYYGINLTEKVKDEMNARQNIKQDLLENSNPEEKEAAKQDFVNTVNEFHEEMSQSWLEEKMADGNKKAMQLPAFVNYSVAMNWYVCQNNLPIVFENVVNQLKVAAEQSITKLKELRIQSPDCIDEKYYLKIGQAECKRLEENYNSIYEEYSQNIRNGREYVETYCEQSPYRTLQTEDINLNK